MPVDPAPGSDSPLGAEAAKLKNASSRRSFALRAEDPEAAELRLVRIAEALGGRSLSAPVDGKPGAQDNEETSKKAGNETGTPFKSPKATAEPPASRPAPAGPAAPVARPKPPQAKDDETGRSGGKAPARSIVLAVPANRLEAFQKALARWSESGRKAAPALATRALEPGFAAGGAGAGAARDTKLICTLADAASLSLDKPNDEFGSKSEADAALGAARVERTVVLVVTIAPEEP
jgi:hypothetical protein